MTGSLPGAYFDALYDADPDPWRFATSDYERDKYAATLAALPERAGAAFEVGCSIGVLTRQLARRCDRLLAVDVAQGALDQASARCADLAQVEFRRMRVPGKWPTGRFDLIVLSEVLYYFDVADIDATAGHVARTLAPGGAVLLVHWLGPTDYPVSGDGAAERFMATAAAAGLAPAVGSRTAEYRLDGLRAG